jgi:hypothetical protein
MRQHIGRSPRARAPCRAATEEFTEPASANGVLPPPAPPSVDAPSLDRASDAHAHGGAGHASSDGAAASSRRAPTTKAPKPAAAPPALAARSSSPDPPPHASAAQSVGSLRRTAVSGGVESATVHYDLPHPNVAVRNLVEQAQFAHLCTVMSNMHHSVSMSARMTSFSNSYHSLLDTTASPSQCLVSQL